MKSIPSKDVKNSTFYNTLKKGRETVYRIRSYLCDIYQINFPVFDFRRRR